MILNLITLETVKTQLGLSVTTYDAQITAMIPIVSNDVRRILNTNYDNYKDATITSGSNEIGVSGAVYDNYVIQKTPFMGQVVYSPGLPADTYIISVDPTSGDYTVSANATADSTYLYETIMISQWPAISKMIFYKISKQTTTAASQQTLASVSYGNVSKSFGPGEINKKYDYPQIFINELGTPFAKVG